MTVTKTPINDPEKVVPNKYTSKAEIRKKKWKNATHGLFKLLFESVPKSLSKSIFPCGAVSDIC